MLGITIAPGNFAATGLWDVAAGSLGNTAATCLDDVAAAVIIVERIGEITMTDVGSIVRADRIGDNSRTVCLKVGCARVLGGRQVVCAVWVSMLFSI